MFLLVVFVFFVQEIDLLPQHMAILPSTSCKLCQLRPVHCTAHIWPTTLPCLPQQPWFANYMLLVRRSERHWQLIKSPIYDVNMWHIWKSISGFEEDDCTIVKSRLHSHKACPNKNPDFEKYYTLLFASYLLSLFTDRKVFVFEISRMDRPLFRIQKLFCRWKGTKDMKQIVKYSIFQKSRFLFGHAL